MDTPPRSSLYGLLVREKEFERKREDRRRYARAAAEWPLELALADGRCKARLRDVSRAGVCFFLDRPIPEMTILELRLCLPEGERGDIHGFGTVVRCESIGPLVEHYEVAVFLHDMTEEDREALAAYVRRCPSGEPSGETSSKRGTPS
jgi:hypothetical protein